VTGIRHGFTLCLALLCAGGSTAFAQGEGEEDLSVPPRLEESPGQSRLAVEPADRNEALEEVVAVGESEWRLPDLGSAWRAREEDERSADRIEVAFLGLYDPEAETVDFDALGINHEMQRVGFLEIFRLRFGRRSTR
jgi:hypothetical protein